MSVMDELTNVVNAARDLLNTVSDKMQQIDQRVDEAANAMPSTVRAMMDVQTWVDGINGDDANSGEYGSPKKTIMSALAKGVPGGAHEINLKKSQTYNITKHVDLEGQNVNILNDNGKSLTSRPVVAFGADDDNEAFHLKPSRGSLAFKGVVIRHPSADGITPGNTETITNAIIRGIGSIVQLDYKFDLPSTVQFGDYPYSIFLTADRGLSTLILALSDSTGTEGKMVANRYGGASMIRIGSHTSASNIKLFPANKESIAIEYMTNP